MSNDLITQQLAAGVQDDQSMQHSGKCRVMQHCMGGADFHLKHCCIEVHTPPLWDQTVLAQSGIEHIHQKRLATAYAAIYVQACRTCRTCRPCLLAGDMLPDHFFYRHKGKAWQIKPIQTAMCWLYRSCCCWLYTILHSITVCAVCPVHNVCFQDRHALLTVHFITADTGQLGETFLDWTSSHCLLAVSMIHQTSSLVCSFCNTCAKQPKRNVCGY